MRSWDCLMWIWGRSVTGRVGPEYGSSTRQLPRCALVKHIVTTVAITAIQAQSHDEPSR
jgi:hypothetical protein